MKYSFSTNFRRLAALMLTLLLLLSLAGCWSKDNPGSTDDQTDPPPPESTAPIVTDPPETSAPTEVPTEPIETEPPFESKMGTITAKEIAIRADAGSKYDAVGYYHWGDRVEILEIKGVWGRTDKGWVSMNHVDLDDEATKDPEVTEPEETEPPVDVEIESDGNTKAKGYGVVTIRSLNVRTGPGTKYDDIDDVSTGQRYAYYQKSGNWVRIDKGWVSVSYFYIEGKTGDGAGKGVVIGSDLNVRSGPGKDYDRVGGLKEGDKVEILAQVNDWGYTGKGWVSMKYIQLEKTESAGDFGSGTVSATSLNIRKTPDEDGEKLGTYEQGTKVKILEAKDGWGRTDKGWISLEYVKLDSFRGIVTATSLYIRKEPSKDAESAGMYENKDRVQILEVKDEWGRTDKGWINLKYVELDD